MTHFPSLSETFVLNQVTGLIDRGHEVDIYAEATEAAATGPSSEEVARYGLMGRVHYRAPAPRARGARARAVLKLWARGAPDRAVLLKTLNPRWGKDATSTRLAHAAASVPARARYDAVLCHFGPNGQLAVRLRMLGVLSGPVVTVFHGYDVSRHVALHGDSVYAQLFAEGDLFLPVSDFFRERLIALGCPPERTQVHRMGVNPARFPFVQRPLTAGEPLRVVSVARLTEKKGIEFGLQAVAAARRSAFPIRYEIIGDGPLRPSLEALAGTLGLLDGVVTFLGARGAQEVRAALQRSHVLLAPSVTAADGDQEGVPVALMEAMSSGCVVVSSRHSGIPELIVDGETGLLTEERDVASLTARLVELARSPEHVAALARNARRTIEREWSVDGLNDALVRLLSALPSR